MKQKILKLIKILNKFTISDILTMDDFDEQEVLSILSEFEELKIIKKISQNQYVYMENKMFNQKNTSGKLYNIDIDKRKGVTDIKSLFSKEEEQEIYENATPNTKRKIVKYYTILKIASQFDDKSIDIFLKQV